jgi:hypothetical protein
MTGPAPENFDAYYAREIRPVLKKLERKRKRLVMKLGALALCIGAVGAGVLVLMAVLGAPLVAIFVAASCCFVVSTLLIWLFKNHWAKSYTVLFKKYVISSVVRFFDMGLSYEAGSKVSSRFFSTSGMFDDQPDRYQGGDKVHGKLGETAIQFSEVHAEYEQESYDSEGRRQTSWVTIFKGLFFVGDFNKEIKGLTVVHPDIAERLFGRLGKSLQSLVTVGHKTQIVKLEDPEFEKYFVVYSTDQVEARYILSSSLMQRLVAFREVTGHGLHLSFRGDKVYVGISSDHDMFEPRVFRTVYSRKLIKTYVADMAMAIGVVEELNLNRRIWTKR